MNLKHTLFFLSAACLTSSALADGTTYDILSIRETKSPDLIQVGKAWRKDSPDRIEVTLRASQDTPAKGVFVRAYFYDKDDNLIHTCKSPNAIWTRTAKGIESVGMPDAFQRNSREKLFFALTPELKKLKPATTLVVFGGPNGISVKTRPSSKDPQSLAFPEKELFLQSASE